MKTIVIAEAGVNHNGNLLLAKKLIDVASRCGATIIKFQKFKAEDIVTTKAKLAKYQKKNTLNEKSQFDLLKKLELSDQDFKDLYRYSKKRKIKFLCSVFDIKALKFLQFYKNEFIKIPSGEITNVPLLEYASQLKKKIILSTGMSTLVEIKHALEILIRHGTKKANITLLHCNTDYPTKIEDVNLKAIFYLKKKFKINVGYSDHTLSQQVPIAAVTMGANIIEKHITLNKNLKGPDHRSSFNEKELKVMIDNIEITEKILGVEKKIVTKSEKKNKLLVRKSIVAKNKIQKGEKFTIYNLTTKRPGNGISPMNWKKVIGQKAKRNYKINDQIK